MRQHAAALFFIPVVLIYCGAAAATEPAPGEQRPQTLSFDTDNSKNSAKGKIDYLLYLPQQYDKNQQPWPLMLFLHGSGERGDDATRVDRNGPPRIVGREKGELPFVIVSPQCPKDAWWTDPQQLKNLNALLDRILADYRIDARRIYLTGLSMGGFGTWHLAAAYPDRFAAIVPICGGGKPADANRLRKLPIWVFHGADDQIVPVARSEEMVEAIEQLGADVRLTVYPKTGHDSYTESYKNPKLYSWLLKHKRPAD
ncbi:MAG: prolyl oligopeptidase family serine peptidase [Pirellulales bacterium]|nr:prolyl oligopeptidase family serine peptidase [Pirellulales bacterium]